jgi:hypothetical protein
MLYEMRAVIAETFNFVLKATLEVEHQEFAPDSNMCVRILNDLRCLAKWNWNIFDSSSSDFDYFLFSLSVRRKVGSHLSAHVLMNCVSMNNATGFWRLDIYCVSALLSLVRAKRADP